jgi:hypothetical protein
MAKKTVADWKQKGWTSLDLAADAEQQVSFDPETHDLVVKGQRFGADGQLLTGKARPKVAVAASDQGAVLTADDDCTVLYKLVAEDEDDAPRPEQLPA